MSRQPKIQPKRQTPLEKAWYILKPFILYMIVKTVAQMVLTFPISYIPMPIDDERNVYYEASAAINALASLIAALFLVKDFLKEVATTGEVDIDASIPRQLLAWAKNGLRTDRDKAIPLALIVSLGMTSSLAVNLICTRIQLQSARYDEVSAIQYSVPLWLGLILYGLISPCVEELVFRGLTYNRMRRFFGIPLCVIATSLLFAGFHANLVQFVYAFCMGILIALCYEWTGCFAAPLLFHMAANIFVFALSFVLDTQNLAENTVVIVVFSVLSVALLAGLYGLTHKQK